jgi:beta-galactosidase GanA
MSQINKTTANQYKALVLPVPIYLSAKDAERMQDYVSNGGNLISEAGAGRINENLMAERGEISPVIAKMAGVQQKSFTIVNEPNNSRRWTPTERSWGEFLPSAWLEGQGVLSGQKMLANYYLQTFELQGGTPVFKAGNEVAGVVNSYGKGKIWLFGTFFGHGGTAYFKDSNLEFVKKLMDEAGVSSQKIGEILVQKRIKGNKEAWILTNPTRSNVTERLDISRMKNVEVLFGDQIRIKKNIAEIQMKSLEIAVIVFENK